MINTLGLWLADGDKIGVHLLEYVFILTAFGVLYDISRKRYGQLIAMFVTILILLSPISKEFGLNFTETYALVFIAVTFWMLAQKDIDDWGRGRLIGVGVLAALTFCMKQQQAMMTYVAIALYLTGDPILYETMATLARGSLLDGVGIRCNLKYRARLFLLAWGIR